MAKVIEPEPKQLSKETKKVEVPAFFMCKQSVLMDAVTIMDGLLHEVVLILDENGLTATAMDQANIALYSLQLKPAEFSEIEGKAEVKVQVKALKGMLKRAASTDNVRITFSNPIELVFASKFNKTFTLPIIGDDEEKIQKIPELNHDAVFKIKTDLITEAIDDAGLVSDSLTMEVKDEELKISAKGDASGYGGDGLGKFTGTKDCVSKFARDYLTKMVKKVADEVTVGLGTD